MTTISGTRKTSEEFDPSKTVTAENISPYISTIRTIWWDGDETVGSLTGNFYTFTARRSDLESELMYFRNRYFSAELGTFASRSSRGPTGEANMLRLSSVTSGTDPMGLGAAPSEGKDDDDSADQRPASPFVSILVLTAKADACGLLNFENLWILDGVSQEGGWVVQKVHAHRWVKDCKRKTIFNEDVSFFEAWEVKKGSSNPQPLTGRRHDFWEGEDMGDCTYGADVRDAKVRFFEGETDPADWPVGGYGWPSTSWCPALHSVPTWAWDGWSWIDSLRANRHKSVLKWNCCPSGTREYTWTHEP